MADQGGKKTAGLTAESVNQHRIIRRSSVRPNVAITPSAVGRVFADAEKETIFRKSETDEIRKIDNQETTSTPNSATATKESSKGVFTPIPSTKFPSSIAKNSSKSGAQYRRALSARATERNAHGEPAKRYEIYLSGRDKELFENLLARFSKIYPGKSSVKKNDLIRSFLPTFGRILKYVDKDLLPARPRYGTPEYKQYTAELGEAIWQATLMAISTELQARGLSNNETNYLDVENG